MKKPLASPTTWCRHVSVSVRLPSHCQPLRHHGRGIGSTASVNSCGTSQSPAATTTTASATKIQYGGKMRRQRRQK